MTNNLSNNIQKDQHLLRKRDLFAIFLRSFFIQLGWNFKSLLSIGLCFAIVPVAKRVCANEDETKQFFKRHLNFFNAHPYFASYALGSIARMEEERALKGDITTDQIEHFKNAIIGPLGAVGDQYFWAAVKPSAILIGMLGVAVSTTLRMKMVSLVGMLLVYNIPHLYVRIRGLIHGYHQSFSIYKRLKMERFGKVRSIYLYSGAFAIGFIFIHFFHRSMDQSVPGGVIFVISLLLTYILKQKKYFYLPIVLSVGLALIIGIVW